MKNYAVCAWLWVCCTCTQVWSQQIIVTPQAGAGNWTVSYTRMFDDSPNQAELSGMFSTLAAAKADAARLQRWSQSMGSSTSWRLKAIYIEGEDAGQVASPNATPKTASFFTAVEQKMQADKEIQNSLKTLGLGKTPTGELAAGLLTKPDETLTKELVKNGLNKAISVAEGEAKKALEQQAADFMGETNAKFTEIKVRFSDYLKSVKDAYKRTEDAKDELLSVTGNLNAQKFKEVNALVDQYNRQADNAPAGMSEFARVIPRMTPVSNESIQEAQKVRANLKTQFELEQQKVELDSRKATLDQTRSQLESEWNKLQTEIQPFDPQNPRVISLRKRLQSYVAETEQYKTSLDSYGQRVQSLSAQIGGSSSGSSRSGGEIGGSYVLFTGQYSNTADTSGGGSGTKYNSLTEAQAAARKHMSANSSKQPSYRIEDSQGTVIEAQGMFKNVKAAMSNAQTRADSRGSSPSSTSQASDTKDCYICWFGDFATYGGATREEAISGGRTSKRMNPDSHIRVTEHRARGTMTINEISQTPGKTILDLP